MPPLILQPLLENAVLHGVAPLEAGAVIGVEAYEDDANLMIFVRNPLTDGTKIREGNRIALENIRERLALHFDVEAHLKASKVRESMLSVSVFPFNVNAPLKVFIVDDEAPARARLHRLLEDCRDVFPNMVVGEASLGQEMLDASMLSAADVVLLDIKMPGMDGLSCAHELMKRKDPPAVIFTTSHADYAVAAFDVAGFD